MKTLLAKELRENFKWLLLGLAIMLLLTMAAVPTRIDNYTNTNKPYLGFAGALFAILLGSVQSIWDFSDRQQGFVQHRSLSKQQIVISKLISGAVIYSVVMGIPLIIAACYFGIMGPEYLPVRPLQVVAPALLIALCYFLHPITIFMVLRSAKWYGTKALLLFLPLALCYFFYQVHDNRWQSWLMFAILATILAVLSLGMFSRKAERLAVVLNSLTAVAFAISLPALYVLGTSSMVSYDDPGLFEGIDENGVVWEVRSRQKYDQASQRTVREILSGSPVISGQRVDVEGITPDGLQLNSFGLMPTINEPAKNYGQISQIAGVGNIRIFWDERGYFLVYELINSQRLLGTITRDGFSLGSEPKGRLFSSDPCTSGSWLQYVGRMKSDYRVLYPLCLISDKDGVYLLDQHLGDLRTVVDKPIFASASVMQGDDFSDGFIVETERDLEQYRLKLSPPIDAATGDEIPKSRRVAFGKVANYPKLPKDSSDRYWSFAFAPNGKLAALRIGPSGQQEMATLSPAEQDQWVVQPIDLVLQTELSNRSPGFALVLSIAPFALVAIVAGAIFTNVTYEGKLPLLLLFLSNNLDQKAIAIYLVVFVLTTSVALACTYFLIHKRSTDKRTTLFWLALTFPLGLAAPLAILAIYPRLVFERCSKCDRVRRVDSLRCEHCGAGWEPLPVQGFEIIEEQQFQNLSPAN